MALIGQTPKLLNWDECINVYINHNLDCIVKAKTFDLDKAQRRLEIVDGLLKAMGVTATVELTEKRDCSEVEVQTEDAGKVIGYRGDCLSAIQYLANIIETKQSPNAKRVVVDAGDYKERREQKLRELAIKVASKVESTGRAYKFEPMNAFERRIIHNELHNYQSVETHSEGIEPHRRLIVTKKAQ